MKKTYSGSCHCGAVAVECDVHLSQGPQRCKCSFCRKARFWMVLVPSPEFRMLRGDAALSDYQHTPRGMSEPFLHLTFCRRCGIRPFSKGGYLPVMGDSFFAVNVGCLDG